MEKSAGEFTAPESPAAKPRRRAPRVAFLSLAVILAPAAVLATVGTIKGRVAGADGKPLSGVEITLRDETRGQTYTVRTDKKGSYFLMGISPAEYKLKLVKPGFQPLEGRVTIEPGQNRVFDAVLAPVAPQAVKPEWEGANVRANELFSAGRYEEAAAVYRGILTSNPNLAAIHFNIGNCAYNLGHYESAIESYAEAVRLKPDFIDAYANMANAYGKMRRFSDAIPVLEGALRAYPESARLFAALGVVYLNDGQGAKAVECLEKAATLDPAQPAVYSSLGIAYTQTAAYGKAVAAYEKYLALIQEIKEIERIKGLIEQLKALDRK
jgi:tetratricopeptide (TPR) repeat protein